MLLLSHINNEPRSLLVSFIHLHLFKAMAEWVENLDQMPYNGANQYDRKVGNLSQPL